MPIGRPVATIVLSRAEKEKLTLIASRPKSNQRDALRARIILRASEGLSNTEIARRERVSLPTVGKWRRRYAHEKIEALADAPRSGAPRSIGDKKVEEVLTKTLETTPRARTHWSSRLMAKEAGISEHSVLRIWRAFGLKPHRVDSFKVSKDPMFVEKVRDIVGLYLNPPEKAIVLCVDEKSQTQALERSQPILAAASRSARASDPRLCASRDPFSVCRLRRGHWTGFRPMSSAPPPSGIPGLS